MSLFPAVQAVAPNRKRMGDRLAPRKITVAVREKRKHLWKEQRSSQEVSPTLPVDSLIPCFLLSLAPWAYPSCVDSPGFEVSLLHGSPPRNFFLSTTSLALPSNSDVGQLIASGVRHRSILYFANYILGSLSNTRPICCLHAL